MSEPSVFERVAAEALRLDESSLVRFLSNGGWDFDHTEAARSALHALATSDEVREALVDVIGGVLAGIDTTDDEDERGWWETSTGAEFGTRKRDELPDAILAAIRPEAT